MSADPRILALAEGSEDRRKAPATPDDLGQLQKALARVAPHTTNTSHPKGTS